MKVRSLCKRIASLLLCASLTGALFTGCKKGDDLFHMKDPLKADRCKIICHGITSVV